MKKALIALMIGLALSISAFSASVNGDNDEAMLFGSPTAPQKKIDTASVSPGINILTGTKNAYTFDDADAADYVYDHDVVYASLYTHEIVNNDTNGKVLSVTIDSEKYLNQYGTNDRYVYASLAMDFTTALDRPVHLYYETYGTKQLGFWIRTGSTHRGFGALGTEEWKKFSMDNVPVFNGTMKQLVLQYATRLSDCGTVQLYDNVAVYPFYKITYKAYIPGSISGSDVIKYYFDASNLSVSTNGVATGFPANYTVENVTGDFPGYNLLGWSTVENSSTVMTNIPLNGEDVVLYPVLEKKNQVSVAITLYFDSEKKQSREYNLFAGDEFTFPGYYDLAAYAPNGQMPKGFVVDGKLYNPGQTIIVPETAVLVGEACYESDTDSKYGRLVFLENFDSVKAGTYIYNVDTGVHTPLPISYINPWWSDDRQHFTVNLGDVSHNIGVVNDGTGNNVLKIQKANTSQRWPQFYIYNNSTNIDGKYTLLVDFCVPVGQAIGISNYNIRGYYSSSKFVGAAGAVTTTDDGKVFKCTLSMQAEAGTVNEALKKYQIYITSATTHENTYFYVDNIALYVKDIPVTVKLSDTKSIKNFYAENDDLILPRNYEIMEIIPDGYEIVYYKCGDVIVMPDEIYTISSADSGKVFEAVYEKKQYSLKFDLGNGNGTVGEIPIKDGETVTLPQFGSVTGWRVYGTSRVYAPSDSFTFIPQNEEVDLDGLNRLIFVAVYDNEFDKKAYFNRNNQLVGGMFAGADADELEYIRVAYEAGIIKGENTFNGEALVSVNELVRIASALYYKSQNRTQSFNTDAEIFADMVNKGVCISYVDTGVNATNADAGIVLANAVANSHYSELAFNVKVNGIGVEEAGYHEALKLIRSGIMPESTDFSKNITYGELIRAIAKVVDPSLRTVENKRRLYFLGDSLTTSVGTIGWPTEFHRYINENLETINYGIAGLNTGSYFVANYGNHNALYLDTIRNVRRGDYVVVALGTNDSTLWGRGTMQYETTRDNYLRYIKEIRAGGGIPILVCPVGRNNTDSNGVYVESDPLIIQCMNDVNELYGVNVPIINFKDVSFERLGAMTAEERLKIYADNVHYTRYGAEVVADWFGELVFESKDVRLIGLANHLKKEQYESSVQIDNDTITVKNRTKTPARLIVAGFDANNRLVDIKTFSVDVNAVEVKTIVETALNTENVKKVKVMMWNGFKNMKPLVKSEEYTRP